MSPKTSYNNSGAPSCSAVQGLALTVSDVYETELGQ